VDDFLLFVAVGFAAQLVDGAIGMAYGLTATTTLLSVGVAPATASAAVHAAEVFTTGASGVAHWRFGNVDLALLRRLALPGMLGGALGASVAESEASPEIPPPGSENGRLLPISAGLARRPRNGSVPIRNGQSGQVSAMQRRTSPSCPPQQSRHLARTAPARVRKGRPAARQSAAGTRRGSRPTQAPPSLGSASARYGLRWARGPRGAPRTLGRA